MKFLVRSTKDFCRIEVTQCRLVQLHQRLFSYPENSGNRFLQIFGVYLPKCTVSHLRRHRLLPTFTYVVNEIWARFVGFYTAVYRRFGTNYRSLLHRFSSPRRTIAFPWKMGKIGRPETSAINCHSMMFNIPGQHWPHMDARWSARGKRMRARERCGGSRRMGLVSLALVGYVADSAWYRPFCRTCKHGDLRLPHWGSLWNRRIGRGHLYRGISPFCPELGKQTSPYSLPRLGTLEHKTGCC